MPILKKEPDLYPPDLFDRTGDGDGSMKWWALYTRSRREKDLMRRLVKQKIGFYSPVVARQHRSPNGRLRTSHVLLFTNYVFLCGDEADRYEAMCTGCVSRDMPVGDPQALLQDLREIHDLIETGVEVTPEPEIPVGTRVRVKSGVLEGREGIVVERRGNHCLLIAVNFLQQGASAELKDCDVEPI